MSAANPWLRQLIKQALHGLLVAYRGYPVQNVSFLMLPVTRFLPSPSLVMMVEAVTVAKACGWKGLDQTSGCRFPLPAR